MQLVLEPTPCRLVDIFFSLKKKINRALDLLHEPNVVAVDVSVGRNKRPQEKKEEQSGEAWSAPARDPKSVGQISALISAAGRPESRCRAALHPLQALVSGRTRNPRATAKTAHPTLHAAAAIVRGFQKYSK